MGKEFKKMPEFFRVFANGNPGFQVTFANGYMVSVMFGGGNYCGNRKTVQYAYGPPAADRAARGVSMDAEVAVLRPDGTWEDPKGWQTVEEMTAILAKTAARERPQPPQKD